MQKIFVVKPWLSEEKVNCICCKNFGGHHMYGEDESESTRDFITEAIYEIVHSKGARKIRIVVEDIGEAEQCVHTDPPSALVSAADSTNTAGG